MIQNGLYFSKPYDGNIEPGVWNIMPELVGDHGQAAGLMANKDKLHGFYENLVKMLAETENQSV